jgi:hypothetical protein
MKGALTALCSAMVLMAAFSCSRSSDDAKRDVDFLFGTIEHVWQVTIDYARKGQADAGLDLCEKYVQERQGEMEAAGKRMSEFMFRDEVREYFAERSQKNRAATDKYEDYITSHLNVAQMKRFNDIIAGLVVEKYMENIQWTTDPVEFQKKALKAKLGL